MHSTSLQGPINLRFIYLQVFSIISPKKKCTYTCYMYNANDEETKIHVLLRFDKAKSKTTMLNFITLIFFMWAVFSIGESKCLLMQISNRRYPLNICINVRKLLRCRFKKRKFCIISIVIFILRKIEFKENL